ncbi:MAG TPA: Hsp20/alpha crystallin family protein [Candidatus Avalokitesvara rifleensis]|uniref:Hsp20/alpha crystallin family protein n=1 Tax=Candidatus Avalokitesvara rifleensis TaxID=3367620 RepID=UPI00271224B0|nr:Hsp20 family protein [Candidatus Brocadiales bacterium]
MKGIHDIKTLRPPQKTRVVLSIQTGSIHRRHTNTRVVERRPIKAWVFTKEPFVRYRPVLDVQRVLDPPLDVFQEAKVLLVVVQIPGADEKDVKVEVAGDVLTLEALGYTRMGVVKYYKEVLLPFEVDGSSMHPSFKDGILQLGLARKAAQGDKSEEAPEKEKD